MNTHSRKKERDYRSTREGTKELCLDAGERNKIARERQRGKETTAFLVASQYIAKCLMGDLSSSRI